MRCPRVECQNLPRQGNPPNVPSRHLKLDWGTGGWAIPSTDLCGAVNYMCAVNKKWLLLYNPLMPCRLLWIAQHFTVPITREHCECWLRWLDTTAQCPCSITEHYKLKPHQIYLACCCPWHRYELIWGCLLFCWTESMCVRCWRDDCTAVLPQIICCRVFHIMCKACLESLSCPLWNVIWEVEIEYYNFTVFWSWSGNIYPAPYLPTRWDLTTCFPKSVKNGLC
jgi:hypothetical protein